MQIKFINLMDLYDPNRVITDYNPLTKDKKFSDEGLFSEKLFGKHNNSEMLAYSCECGNIKGKFMLGYKCELCNTKVELRESNLEKLAWIDLGKFWAISPIFYFLLAKLTGGNKKLNDMIKFDKTIDRDGHFNSEEEEDNGKEKPKYQSVGLVFFHDNFFKGEKIFKYIYKNSKYEKKEIIKDIILQNKDKVFINKVPVFDTMLRPASITFKDKPIYRFDEINNSYNFIIKLSEVINKEKNLKNQNKEITILPNLYEIQLNLNTVCNKIIENLAGKTGFIRNSVLGNRLNFSSRCVITPLPPGYDICDIVLPYIPFVELYSFHLMNMISKMDNISLLKAQKIVLEAEANYDQRVFKLCQELVKRTKHGLLCLGIRNPTIARGSVLCHRIAGIKEDPTDFTASVHNNILQLIAGDYDGILTLYIF